MGDNLTTLNKYTLPYMEAAKAQVSELIAEILFVAGCKYCFCSVFADKVKNTIEIKVYSKQGK